MIILHKGFRAEKVSKTSKKGWDIFHGTFNCGWVRGNKKDVCNLIDEIIKQREQRQKELKGTN